MENPGLRVAMYAPTPSGGHARYCHELLSAMANIEGHESPLDVLLVTSKDLDEAYRTADYAIEDFLPPLTPREEFKSDMRWIMNRATHYARREGAFLDWLRSADGCDAVHIQEYTPWLAARGVATMHRLKKRVYATVHNIRPHRYPAGIPARIWDGWNKAAWRECDALFVHTSGLARQLADFLGPGHPDIVVVPHGIWSDQLRGVEEERRPLSGKLLFYGQMRRSKGLDVLLEALRRLPECSLTVAGAPETPAYGEAIRASVSRVSGDRVVLRDEFIPDEDVPSLFHDADLIVLPYSTFSSQSGVLHDAIAYGRPVVVTDVGALGESVREWGIGQVARPNDATDLARAIAAALEPTAYQNAKRALERVRDDLSWSKAAQITCDTYRGARSHG